MLTLKCKKYDLDWFKKVNYTKQEWQRLTTFTCRSTKIQKTQHVVCF